MRITWLRRAGGQRNRTRASRPAARDGLRRNYRPYAEWLEDRTVLSATPLTPVGTFSAASFAAVTATAPPAKITASRKPSGVVTPTAAQRLPDFTALLFAAETPDLPAVHLPTPLTPINGLVQAPKAGVFPVPPAGRPIWTGPSGGIVPETSTTSHQVFFSPSTLLHATAGEVFESTVTTVAAPSEYKPGARYQATIDWGDGTAATTGVVHVAGKLVGVEGRHTYTRQGHFAVQVHIEIDGHGLRDVAGTATVSPAAPVESPTSDKPVPEIEVGPTSRRPTDPEKWSTVVLAAATFALAPNNVWPTRRYRGSRWVN